MQTNIELRSVAKKHGVRLWEIAEAIGITDGMFSRRLRHELSEAEREQIIKIIEEIAQCKG